MKTINRYDYEELKNAAIETNSKEDIENLVEWFEKFGNAFWNGEYYEIDNNMSLRPVYNLIDYNPYNDIDNLIIDHWEIF